MDNQIKHAALLKDAVDMHLHVAPSLMKLVMVPVKRLTPMARLSPLAPSVGWPSISASGLVPRKGPWM